MAADAVRMAHMPDVRRLAAMGQLVSTGWSCRGGRSTAVKAHTAGLESVCFSPDGHLLLSAGDDKAVKARHD